MFEVLRFIFHCIVKFIKMLFTIDLGFTSLGVLMCIVYIFLPIVLRIVNFLKDTMIDELDEAYDIKRRTYYYNQRKEKKKRG